MYTVAVSQSVRVAAGGQVVCEATSPPRPLQVFCEAAWFYLGDDAETPSYLAAIAGEHRSRAAISQSRSQSLRSASTSSAAARRRGCARVGGSTHPASFVRVERRAGVMEPLGARGGEGEASARGGEGEVRPGASRGAVDPLAHSFVVVGRGLCLS